MKRRFSLIAFAFLNSTRLVHAQPIEQQRIEDTVLHWHTPYVAPKVLKEYSYLGQTFTTAQQAKMNPVFEWMRKTYTPVGGLGTQRQMIFAERDAYAPHTYGCEFRSWNVSLDPMWLDAKKNFKPVSEEYVVFTVMANFIPASFPIYFINRPGRYLFTWQPEGYAPNTQFRDKYAGNDPRIHPNAYPFLTRTNYSHTVFLVPGNRLPVIPVTIREFLLWAEEAVETKYRNEGERYERYRNNITSLRKKYQQRLDSPAELWNMQATVNIFDGSLDPFEVPASERTMNRYFPVYRIDSLQLEKCKSNTPQ